VRGVVDSARPGAWGTGHQRSTIDVPAALRVPELGGAVLEALQDAPERRRTGAHHTPVAIAARLVAIALDGLDPPPSAGGPVPTVCDPAVGGGVFLLAAARHLHGAGHPVGEVLGALHGSDVDPLAVATARASLAWWAADAAGGDVAQFRAATADTIVVADGLTTTAATWGHAAFDAVVGNPPFLSQLGRATARDDAGRRRAQQRFGAGGYTDTAGLFLLLAIELTRPGGRVVMVQPESLMTARDAGPVRGRVAATARLTDLWIALERVFEASVRVCAPVLSVGPPGHDGRSPGDDAVVLWRGAEVVPAGSTPRSGTDGWGAALARLHGTPDVVLAEAPTLGSLATATAGFRDQFYGLAPHVIEQRVVEQPVLAGDGDDSPPPRGALVTSGAIDPGGCAWGRRTVRFAGRRWERPVVDLAGLAVADPRLHRWVEARLRPKVLVATQTRVLEAVADPDGRLVPSVPVVAVECDPDDVWRVAAALLAPPVTAWALHRAAGSALTGDALKLSARQLLDVPLPVDLAGWVVAAGDLAAGTATAEGFGAAMVAAYGLRPGHPVLAWWLARLPSWPASVAGGPASGAVRPAG